jgi:muramidase (phage lysozyme)
MMTIADLLPLLYQNAVPMSLGGPAPAMLPKASTNATPGNIPAVRTPPMSSPTDFMNAATQAQNVASEVKLRDLQGQQTSALVDLIKQAGRPAPAMFDTSIGTGASGGTGTLSIAPDAGQSRDSGAAPAVSSYTADATMLPEQRALLDSIAGPESRGSYNIRYTPGGGASFEGYDDHPRIFEPTKEGKKSSAAGRYQIVASTWDPTAQKLGLSDFSPVSQDRAAWSLAEAAYHVNTGRDLLSDLQKGDTSRVASALSGEWPTIGKAIKSYSDNLAKYSRGGAAVGEASSQPAIPDLPDTSLAGTAGTFVSAFGGGAMPTGSGYATALQRPSILQSAATLGSAFGSLAPALPAPTGDMAQYTRPGDKGGPVTVDGVTYPSASAWNRAMDARAEAAGPTMDGRYGSAPQQPVRLAQNGATPFGLTPPVAPPTAPPPNAVAPPMMPPTAPFGSLAPGMPPVAQPGAPRFNPAFLSWAQQQDRINAALGRRSPEVVSEALKMALSQNPAFLAAQEAAKKGATAPIELQYAGPMAAAQAWGKAPAEIYTAWNKPVNARPGGAVVDPSTGRMVGAVPTLQKVIDPATGRESWQYMSPMSAQNGGTGPNGAGGSPGVAGLGPGERQALVTRAEKEQADRQKVIDEANSAQQQRATLLNMANEAGRFYQGPGAPQVQGAARYLRTIFPSFDGQVASYEDFVKNAGNLTRQAVRETSSRAAVQEFRLIGDTLPSVEMSPRGLQSVQNELIGLTDYRIAKAQAQQAWEQAHGGPGNVTNFETTFQRQASPYAFVVARMDAPDRQELFAKLQSSAQGRQELARLGQQLQFLKQSGLAQ